MSKKILPKAVVKDVQEGSIAFEAGIQSGDVVSKVNGKNFRDILEYKFLISDEEIELEIIKANGEIEIISIYNENYEDLGIMFKNSLIDNPKHCANNCIFCFIDQLPKNMRKTLYFKDDDYRLSFLLGNYITLTNISDDDINRLIKLRLSPINISVHTTNPDLRVKILRNKNANLIMKRIKKLVDNHIILNCQIVLCRNINDKQELDRSIADLTYFYPYVNSISVVPVGLTKHRQNLYKLKSFDRETSIEVINQIELWQKKLLKKCGSRIVFAADEFYIMGETPIPEYGEYEKFPQIENGVGLIACMQKEFDEYIKCIPQNMFCNDRNVSIATGVSAKCFISNLANSIVQKTSGLNVNVFSIKNDFFGKNVTVAGLITGQDLISQLKDKNLGDELLIPIVMLRDGENVFLDNISISEVEKELAVKIITVENNGKDFINKVIGANRE